MLNYNLTAERDSYGLIWKSTAANLGWPIGAILLLAAVGYTVILLIGYCSVRYRDKSTMNEKTHSSVVCDYCPCFYAFTDVCLCSCSQSSEDSLCYTGPFPHCAACCMSNDSVTVPGFECSCFRSCSRVALPTCTGPCSYRQLDCCCIEIHFK